MNISIVGPEGSGKTTLANDIARRAGFGRPVFFIGPKKTTYRRLELKDLHAVRNAVVIIDDANSFIESYDVYNKSLNLKSPFVLHREYNVMHICIFHSFDDAVKYFFRQSRYIYVSKMYRDESFTKNKFIKGIAPVTIGRGKFLFDSFRRY